MDKNEKRGYIQVYTGNGKGKTTAAIGLAIRAAGAGLKVYMAQFIKMGDYSEIKALKRFSDLITVEQFGLGRFMDGKPLRIQSHHFGRGQCGRQVWTHPGTGPSWTYYQ
jgi:ATP:corrinoid adenosyltransferase